MRHSKKFVSLLLALTLVMSCFTCVSLVYASAADDTAAVVGEDPVYSVAGSSAAIFGAGWDAANEATEMTKGEDGKYSITFPACAPEENVGFKVVTNHSWDEAYGKNGNNVVFNVETECDVTITFDPETKEVSVSGEGVVIPEFKVETMRAVGGGEGAWLNGVSWGVADDKNLMTEKSEGVYEIAYEGIDGGDYSVKFAANGDWTINFGLAKDGSVEVKTNEPVPAAFDGDNIEFEVVDDNSTVTLTLDLTGFDPDTKEGAKFTIDVKAADEADETTVPAVEETTAAPVEETTAAPAEETTAAPAGDKLTVTATSNITPTVTRSFDPGTEQITVTYWINCDKKMINCQWLLTYDKEVLEYDEAANQVYNEEDDEYTNMVFRVTKGENTEINTNPPSAPGGGIRANVTKLKGFKLNKNGEKVAFVSVTFKPKAGAKGNTEVKLDVEVMQISDGENPEYYLINESAVQADDKFMPDNVPVAIYAGPFDNDATMPEEEATTEAPTTEEPTTEAPTTEEPTTEAPTTEEPTTEAPTTEEPTTEEPTTEAPTTEAPTTVPATGDYLKVTATSNFFPETSQTYYEGEGQPLPDKVTVLCYIDSDKYKIINGQFEIQYDPSVLTISKENNYDDEEGQWTVCPVAPANAVANLNYDTGKSTVNFAKFDGANLKKKGEAVPVVQLVFDVVGKGETVVNIETVKLTVKDKDIETSAETWVEVNENGDDFAAKVQEVYGNSNSVYTVILPDGNKPVVPTEPETTTEEPTTEAVDAVVNVKSKVSAAATDTFTITDNDNVTAIATQKGETVTVTYKLKADKLVESLQWVTNYDTTGLKLVSVDTSKFTTGSMINPENAADANGTVKFNASSIDPVYDFTGDDVFVTFTFDVIAAGEFDVELDLTDICFKEPEPEPTTEEPTTEEPTTEEPTTEEPTTETPEQPTTEAPTTVAPTTKPATPDTPTSPATPSQPGSGGNGAVQTGSASMAIIILLVLVSATAAIFFARRKEEK